jgi:phage/plasmid-associated DNA primase
MISIRRDEIMTENEFEKVKLENSSETATSEPEVTPEPTSTDVEIDGFETVSEPVEKTDEDSEDDIEEKTDDHFLPPTEYVDIKLDSKPKCVERSPEAKSESEPVSSPIDKPVKLAINFDNIPEKMKSLRNWVYWKKEESLIISYQSNGEKANPKGPNTWSTLEELRECADKYDGIGFILTEDCQLLVVKFNDAKVGDVWNEEALEEIKSLNSYSEILPTKTGASVYTFVFAYMNKGQIESDRRAMYVTNKVFNVKGNVFGEVNEINEAQEAVNSLHIKWFNSTTGINSTNEDYVKLLKINIKFSASESAKLNDAKNFIESYMMDEEKDFVIDFIEHELQDYFGFTIKIASKRLVPFYKEKKKKHDAEKIKQRVIDDLDIDPKYKGMYSFYINNKADLRMRINIHPDKIADYILSENYVITHRDTMFVYREGFYRPEKESVQDKIVLVLNDICKGDNSDKITNKIKDVMTQIETKTRVHDYPFNDYLDALPVENGVIVFDFESETCKLEDHDPEKYRFNYQIPVKYDPDLKNTVIYEVFKEYTKDPSNPYTDNAKILVQIPAQAFMQAMGNGPYKRAYLVYGVPNTGKTTFLNILQELVGKDGFHTISLAQINQRFQAAELEGKLFNLHDDMEYFKLREVGPFKSYTGERHHLIERKNKDPYTGILDAVHVFNTNNPPAFDLRIKSDLAFWERWCYIEFKNKFAMNGNFKNDIFTPENMSSFLNSIVDMMLVIGKNKKLPVEVDWSETRENWALAGNPLLMMINDLMTDQLTDSAEDRKIAESRSAIMTYFLKEELLKILQNWCREHEISEEMIPKSVTALTELVDVCGWDSNEQKYFEIGLEKRRCYAIPYKWKCKGKTVEETRKICEYRGRITRLSTAEPKPESSESISIDGESLIDSEAESYTKPEVDTSCIEDVCRELDS